jgi:hypothetical protein
MMTYLLLTTALTLSAIAAYYAVAGLMAIFAASAIPIMIMGGTLEASKLVVASWLYRNWRDIPFLMKTYFTTALIILMLLTSMGIFGYLSKAHLDQAIPSGDVASKLNLIDEKIKTQKDNVETSRKAIQQMDAQVDQTLSRSDDTKGAERAVVIRRQQQKERAILLSEIGSAQKEIAKLNEERAPIAAEVRKVEAEVGPIKYIAALLYDNTDEGMLEKAVRIVIIMIVLVFDPLAVLMLIAYNREVRLEEERNRPPDINIGSIPKVRSAINPKTHIVVPPPTSEPAVDLTQFAEVTVPEPHVTTWTSTTTTTYDEPKDEPKEEWSPELFKNREVPPETTSFLNKVQDIVSTPTNTTQETTPKESETSDEFTISSDVKEIVKSPRHGRPERFK